MKVEAIEKLESNPDLLDELIKEVQELIDKGLDFQSLSEDICSKEERWTCFYHGLMKFLISEFNLSEPQKEEEVVSLLSDVRKNLYEHYPKMEYESRRELKKFILLYYVNIKEWNCIKICTSHNREHSGYYEMKNIFFTAIADLSITSDEILQICIFYDENTPVEDLARGEIYTGISALCRLNRDIGWSLINKLVEENEPRFLLAVISGLPSTQYTEKIEYLKTLASNGRCVPEAIAAMGFIDCPSGKELTVILNYLFQLAQNDVSIQKSLSMAYMNILNQSDKLSKEQLDNICNELARFIDSEELGVRIEIINRLSWLNDNVNNSVYSLKKRILFKYTDIDLKYGAVVSKIANILHSLIDQSDFFDFLEEWSMKHPFMKTDEFNRVIKDSLGKNKSSFINRLIRMLISNEPEIRYFANTIIDLDNMDILSSEWLNSISPLDAVGAVKLIDSLLMDVIFIKERIQLILPLINHSSEKARNHLLQWLVWLVHDFGELVKDTVLNYVETGNASEKDFEIFLNQYDGIISLWNTKRQIKEMQSSLTHGAAYTTFIRINNKHRNREINKGVEEKSFLLQLMTKIEVGRGYGWRFTPQSMVQPMNEIKTSFPLPMTNMRFPEGYEYDKIVRRTMKWK